MKKSTKLLKFFGWMYLVTSLINLYLGIFNSEMLLGLKETALIGLYRGIIIHSSTFMMSIFLLIFSVYQLLLSYLILNKRDYFRIVGILGGLLFHIMILPWGWWSMFNLIFIIGLAYTLKKEFSSIDFTSKVFNDR